VLRQNHDTEENEVMKMSKEATKEYVLRMRTRYTAMKTKKAKGRVLDDFCATTELGRKHAIKVLRSRRTPLQKSGRRRVYGADVTEALKAIWLTFDQPCSKLLHSGLTEYVASWERHHGAFPADVRQRLAAISPSSMDRLLRPARRSTVPRRRRPRGVAAVKREVPIRVGAWNVTEPGWIEADTVSHDGGCMSGGFVWSLTMTDILTQWTEIRAIWCRGAAGTVARIREIEAAVPFPLRGFDSDNGPEFMNWHLFAYFKDRTPAVVFTRSRAYQKNDNAHVEQKNGTHVRGLLGHERIDDPACVDALNQALLLASLWKNLYAPAMKLVSKTRHGHRYRKTYDQPRTPAQRILECPLALAADKQKIRQLLDTHDCLTLKQTCEKKLQNVFTAIRARAQVATDTTGRGAGTSALRAAPSGSVPASRPVARPAHQKVHKQTTRLVS
jgi:hypothetical protein